MKSCSADVSYDANAFANLRKAKLSSFCEFSYHLRVELTNMFFLIKFTRGRTRHNRIVSFNGSFFEPTIKIKFNKYI
ncbi:Uncharacterised protein [Yersinia enterocolitica]|nr:Uncharacterised protein [Yersinia enterocolitica]